MSRSYEMYVKISRYKAEKKAAIEDAAEDELEFNDLHEHGGELSGTGHGQLCGGESESEFAKRFAKTIFEANGGPCTVEVNATCLDELPYNTYTIESEEDL